MPWRRRTRSWRTTPRSRSVQAASSCARASVERAPAPGPCTQCAMDIDVVRQSAIPLLDGVAGDYDAVLRVVDGARVVILGIGWPGSHELFQGRVELTKRLIADMGFSSVCLDEPIDVVQAIDAYLMGWAAINPVAGSSDGTPAPRAT